MQLTPLEAHTTSENLLKWTTDYISRVDNLFYVRIVGVVTTGAANMNRKRKHLAISKLVFTYSCQVHLLNLICKELYNLFTESTNEVFQSHFHIAIYVDL